MPTTKIQALRKARVPAVPCAARAGLAAGNPMVRPRVVRALVASGLAAGVIAVVLGMTARDAVATLSRPSIQSVAFSGKGGSGQSSPTITITGSHFGSAPTGTSDNSTACGPYTANGDVYGSKVYFTDDGNFEAGYGSSTSADCVGIVIVSWSTTQVVLQFGNAYGSFAHWYLSNGDGFALSLKTALWGGQVSGLS